jgi:tocopherol O-methyltransferase
MLNPVENRGSGASNRRVNTLSADAIRNHYDRFAWAYRLYWGDHLHHGLFRSGQEKPREAQEILLRHCATRAGLRRGSNVVDAGCGYGGTARFFATEYSCSVLGLTISQAQWKVASKLSRSVHGPGSVRFELADAEAYAFPRSSFDLVWNMESLGHFFHKAHYFAKVTEALKPGGRFLLADWTGSMDSPIVRQVADAFLCPDLFTAEEYSQKLQAAGMTPA